MKNVFKKVNIGLVALLALAAIFVPMHAAHAGASFNNDPQDRATLRVTNSTLNPGCTTCWTQTITGVRNGDYVSFAIYYHNTGTSAAQNTRVRLTTTAASGGVQATGYVSADNASTVSGSASAYFDSALQNGELAYDAVLWYPNQTQTAAPLPGGQTGQEVLSTGGLNIGTINPGWPSQGSVVVRFRAVGNGTQGGAPIVVTNAATNVAQNSATLNGSVNPNGANTSYWFEYGTTQNLGNTTPQQNAGLGTSAQSVSVSLTGLVANTTYYFRIDGQNQYGTSQGSILSFSTGSSGSAPIVVTNAATNIQQTSATLNGSVNPNGADAQYWFEIGTTQSLGNQSPQQSVGSGTTAQQVSLDISSLQQNTTYYFRVVAQNSFGTSQGSVLSFTTGAGQQGSAPIVITNAATNIQQNSATVNGTVNPNGANAVYWFEYGTTQNLGNTTPQQNAGSGTSAQSVSASLVGLVANTTYYFRVDAQNQYGTAQGSILSFTTGGQQGSAPIAVTYSASNIQQTSATLNGSVNPNGAATTYWFEMGTTQSLGTQTPQQTAGSGTTAQQVSLDVSSLQQNTTYYFRVVAQNQYGTSQGSILSFTTGAGQQGSAPTVITYSATNVQQNSGTLNGSVNPNGANTVYWFEYGTTYSLGNTTMQQSVGSGTNAQQVSYTITGLLANTTYYFRVDAQNQYGTAQGSILSFTTGGGGGYGSAPIVQTNPATNIYQNSAMLNGTVNPNGYNTSYWFEYGTSYNLGNSTMQQSLGSGTYSQSVSAYISGLQNNTTYYFRIDAQNQYGTVQGSVLTFNTGNGSGGCGTTVPYVQTNTATNVQQNGATLNANVSYTTTDMYGWFAYGTDPNNLYQTTSNTNVGGYYGNYNNNYGTFSQSLYNLQPNTTYYYQAIVRNSCGSWYGQVLNFNTSGGYYYGGQMPTVITDPATSIAQNSALLNGRVNPNGSNATAWFEYGATANLGLRTSSQTIGSGTTLSNYSLPVTGLAQNTTYYFRAVAQNQSGTAYGSTLTFTTSGGGGGIIYNPPTVIQRPVVVTTAGTGLSCIMLVPALDVSQLVAGQQFTYTVTYRNGCNFPLNAAFLKVILPTDVDFVSTNYPFYNKDANGLSYNLGVVPQGFQAAISLTGVVHKDVLIGNTLVFSAVLNFNDAYGHLQSVAAYLTALVAAGGALTASVFDAFAALLGNWIFDLILFLILLLAIIYWIFFRKKETTVVNNVIGQPPVVEDEGVDVLRAAPPASQT